ncbi:MAG TPA: NAD(P)-dependent alcohol dehydrogenase [Caulobacteraceae bacterium]|nr:NAD(P)-dependent alcohol dehydrogenase [Caulobacteraceae bacterium]
MIPTSAYAAFDSSSPLKAWSFERRDLRPDDVEIDILFCGVCHSDLHAAKDEWGEVNRPFVPGHEIVGRVASVGAEATKYKVGDLVGVGCLVDSCLHCTECDDGLEQYCSHWVGTYMGVETGTGKPTYGGYSSKIVVKEHFVLRMPEGLDPAAAAPLLCAGITTYSPLRHWKVSPGQHVGVVGLGGLGHMAVKLAKAMGAHVTVFTTSPSKIDDAKRLGADAVIVSRDEAAMAGAAGTFDYILNTVAASHNLDPFINALKRDGTMTLVGAPSTPHPSPGVMGLIFKRRSLAGSLIGGIAETQEMLDFCAEHGVTADIELIPIQDINIAYERMLKSDVKYRFVIDMSTLAKG